MTFESVFKAMLTTSIGVLEIVIGEFVWLAIRASLMATGVALVLLVIGLVPNPLGALFFPVIGALFNLCLVALSDFCLQPGYATLTNFRACTLF